MTDLPLTVLNESTKVITLGWTPPPNCVGYVFYVNNNRVSNTWNPAISEVRFNKVAGGVYKVRALSALAEGAHPPQLSEKYGADKYSEAVYSH